ncbi:MULTISPECIES: aspartate-semialdehyde dehydrogenase [unclassified Candidatus Frackibacter]|uniref:aspartate-semialdehyde dehydrogenase n=1 Tax=unclassified Candidatus Frackibacter TaxID=2648818 RepID=UPI00079C594F|nr:MULTISPECIES: aspartate-semialdehyde dehydrogenase [unclassified Candidatus Frackibacter]KXS37208.1 MAG: aspartate-semialdehyde dehydrogenase [Candidatus Frackibacter sp. T328-2]SDB98167.1 aspartate semialdehyde dehydrogenase [Candidatus Frackibacter sp. WG11]SFL34843.1 aspartate semialdehyde dehydrogenase [Candidatus Frackibacter sp. WG13]
MKEYNIAIVGAAGAVGREMLSIVQERELPYAELKLLEKEAGKFTTEDGNEYEAEAATPEAFEDIDIALFSAGSEASKKLAPEAAKRGTIVVDNSSAFRMDPEVPLVVPEVNPEDIDKQQGIIANPNCSTIQMVAALKPIYDKVGIKRVVISTYQAVSGSGKAAMDELLEQSKAILEGKEAKAEVYPHQIAFNALPHIDIFFDDGYTKEEMKMVNETKKILGDDSIKLTATTVRIPVLLGHAESINLELGSELEVDETKELLDAAEGVRVVDNPGKCEYPMQIQVEETDDVLVGRIRKDNTVDAGLNLWIVANNLRKGAALNTVQIAEKLIEKGV